MKKFMIVVVILLVLSQIFMTFCLLSNKQKAKREIENIFSSQKVISISETPKVYICPKEDAVDIFKEFMKQNGWDYMGNEQLGAGYVFSNGSDRCMFILTHEKFYARWELENNTN